MVAIQEISRFVAETTIVLNEKSGSPVAGVILVVGLFMAIWVFSLLRNPP